MPKHYVDPLNQIKEREYEEKRKKGKYEKEKKYVTKRGCYIDDVRKIKNFVPAPGKYNVEIPWVRQADIEKGKKLPKDTKKMTYIEQIYHDNKKYKFPGPGQYVVRKGEEEIKKEIEELRKKKIQ